MEGKNGRHLLAVNPGRLFRIAAFGLYSIPLVLSFSAMTALYGSLENVFDVEARTETGGL
jgi:hypothetical protein